MGALIDQIDRILVDYEAHCRKPHLVLEVLSGLLHQVEQDWGMLPSILAKVNQVVCGWQAGRREDLEALKAVAGLIRH